MFFYISKIAWFFLQPSNMALLITSMGSLMLLAGFARRAALAGTALGAALLLIFGFSPLSNLMIFHLEQQFEERTPGSVAGPVKGIIVLGGFEDSMPGADRSGLALNFAGERVTEALRLAAAFPEAKLVFTGATVQGIKVKSGDERQSGFGRRIRELVEDLGFSPDRLVFESRSRNTFENAKKTMALLAPTPGDTWIMVTSAMHMPRAMGVFRKVGFNVLPYPVDYRSDPQNVWSLLVGVSQGLLRTDFAVREYIGLLAYWLTGRTSALLPTEQS